jgi:serine/threonine protein kinase
MIANVRQPVPFGKYILLDRVSVGGMAEVFKAKSFGVEGFEKVIAVKRILPSMGEDTDFIGMFIDEAKIAGQLAHANICQIFELGKIETAHFIAMEYIWGKDLLQIQNRLRKLRQVMDVPMACFVIAKVCEGLDYAHRKRDALGQPMNIVHRDCSPQNVLISYEGEVKLIDFGIAKAASRSSKTVAGVLKGKFGYMSPEQVRGLALDRRSDVFAVGTVLYECITGERLFQCESDFSTLEKVRNVAIFPPSHFNRAIPPELECVVMKALARNPEERYQWASELQADLQQLLMKQQQVFTAKSLGSWIKTSFAAELQRERQLMEKYRRVGRDGVTADATPEPERAQPAARRAPMEGLRGASPRGKPTTGEFDEGPTEIYGELTVDQEVAAAEVLVGNHGNGGTEAPRPRPRASSVPPPAPASNRALTEEPTVAKVVVHEGTPRPAVSTSRPMMVLAPPPATGEVSLAPGGEISFGGTAAVPALTATARPVSKRSSMFKDVGIGLGIAAAVLLIFAGAKLLFFGDKPGTRAAEASTGTIAITVPDSDPADVHVNGERVGRVEGGEAFKLGSLAPGDYQVVVRRDGVPDCVRKVDLAAEALEVVNCPFEKAKPKPSYLHLTGAMEGTTVFVDDQQVSEEAASEPMLLESDTEHRVRVEREGEPPQQLAVKLAPGETKTHVVPAAQQLASLDQEKRDHKRDRGDDGDDDDDRGGKRARSTDGTSTLSLLERLQGPDDDDDAPGEKAKPKTRSKSKSSDKDDAEGSEKAVSKDAPENGFLVAWTTPWARVFIDGKDTGKMTPIAPRAKVALEPGKHRVTFVVGSERFSYPVVIEAGETKKLRQELPVQAEK